MALAGVQLAAEVYEAARKPLVQVQKTSTALNKRFLNFSSAKFCRIFRNNIEKVRNVEGEDGRWANKYKEPGHF